MMKVPGSYSSLSREKGDGRDIRVVYSPLDALADSRGHNPDKTVVFLGVGFETTAPTVASAIITAHREKHRATSRSCRCTRRSPRRCARSSTTRACRSTGSSCRATSPRSSAWRPTGSSPRSTACPSVITGFEPVDVLQGVYMLAKQIAEGRPAVEIAYARVVPEEGNPTALARMDEVFEPEDADWRGIGVIPGTGLAIREEYAGSRRPGARARSRRPSPRTTGAASAATCCAASCCRTSASSSARRACPSTRSGPCMVSSEGSCAAYYRYTDYGKRA